MNLIRFATLRTADGYEVAMTVDLELMPFDMEPPTEDTGFSEMTWDITSALTACRLMVYMGLWTSTDRPSDPIPHLFTSENTVDELAALIETALAIEGDNLLGGWPR